jgi:hypothetical protein
MEYRDEDPVVSVVMSGRDDNYGNIPDEGIRDLAFTPIPYIDRLANTIEKFDSGFKKIGVTAEIIIVDWAPTKFLFENPTISRVCRESNVRFVIVTRSMVRKMKLNPNGFDEFFAKNIGIRNAIGDFILLTNSDAWPDQRLFRSIREFLQLNLSSFYGRPHSRIDLDATNKPTGEGLSFNEDNLDGVLGTAAAGDFVLTKRVNISLVGGYNESGTRKSTITRQAGLDGQLLMTLYLRGIKPKKLQGSILTYDHNKIQRLDYGVPHKTYTNNSKWGLSDQSLQYLSPNVTIINHENLRARLQSLFHVLRRKSSTFYSILSNRIASHEIQDQSELKKFSR